MICYLLHSEFFKKAICIFIISSQTVNFCSSILLIASHGNAFIFLSVPNEKIVPYQLIFTENEIELWA